MWHAHLRAFVNMASNSGQILSRSSPTSSILYLFSTTFLAPFSSLSSLFSLNRIVIFLCFLLIYTDLPFVSSDPSVSSSLASSASSSLSAGAVSSYAHHHDRQQLPRPYSDYMQPASPPLLSARSHLSLGQQPPLGNPLFHHHAHLTGTHQHQNQHQSISSQHGNG